MAPEGEGGVRWACRSLVSDIRTAVQEDSRLFFPAKPEVPLPKRLCGTVSAGLGVQSCPKHSSQRSLQHVLNVTEILLMRSSHEKLRRKKEADAIFLKA